MKHTRLLRAVVFLSAVVGYGSLCLAERYAVLVGVERYEHPDLRTPPLRYAVDDVTDLSAILRKSDYQVALLTDDSGKKNERLKPTRSNIEKAVRTALRKCSSGDTILLAFAGHGLQFEDDDEAYFCPSDARPFPRDRDTLVSLKTIYKEMESSFAGAKVILVDACRNDPDRSRGRSALSADTVRPPRGVGVLFSCSPGQRAYEHDDLGHGLFFHYVIEKLEKTGAEDITYFDLAGYVGTRVARRAPKLIPGSHQTPNSQGNVFGAPVLIPGRPSAPGVIINPGGPPRTTTVFEQVVDPIRRADYMAALSAANTGVTSNPRGAVAYAARALVRLEYGKDLQAGGSHLDEANNQTAASLVAQAKSDVARALQIDSTCREAVLCRAKILNHEATYDQALRVCNQALNRWPADAELLTQRAVAHEGLGDLANKKKDLSAAERIEPDNADVLNLLGCDHFNACEYEEGLTYIERALEQAPSWWLLYNNRIYGLDGLQQAADGDGAAIESRINTALNEAMDVAPGSSQIARQWLQREIREHSDDEGYWRTAISRVAQHHGNERASEWANQVIPNERRAGFVDEVLQRYPTNFYFNASKYFLELNQENGGDASVWLDRLVEISPDTVWARFRRAEARKNAGRFDEAIKDLQHALSGPYASDELKPALMGAMAETYEAAGNKQRAISTVRSAVKLYPSHEALGQLKARLEGGGPPPGAGGQTLSDADRARIESIVWKTRLFRFRAAADEARAWCDESPNTATPLAARGLALLRWAIDERKALWHEEYHTTLRNVQNDLRRALELDPRCVLALTARALMHQTMREDEQALADARTALQIAPYNRDALLVHAHIVKHSSNKQLVRADLDNLQRLYPDDPAVLSLEAETLMRDGQIRPALSAIDRAIAKAPEAAVLRVSRAICLDELGLTTEFHQTMFAAEQRAENSLMIFRMRLEQALQIANSTRYCDERFREYQKRSPNPVLPYRWVCHPAQLRRSPQARAWAPTILEEGLRRFPNDPVLLTTRAAGNFHRPSNAMNDLRKALDQDGGYVEAFLVRARLHATQGRVDEAVADTRTVRTIPCATDEEIEASWIDEVVILREANRRSAARRVVNDALRDLPGNGELTRLQREL